MKRLHLLLIGIFLSLGAVAQNSDPVILTIDGEDIYASEFLYIYSKNNENPSFDKDSLDDYMQLFINYKLKVKEAKSQNYDTIPRLVSELAQYRKQLSLPYMTDKEKNEKLIKEAYDRTASEVRASHILVRMKADPSPADTNAAYVKAMQMRQRIIKGEDFEKVARGKGGQPGSEDPSVKSNGGDLGYFSALQMVYPFENAAYETPVGEVSMPVRTQFGYHLIKVTDRRPAPGTYEAAHILILANENKATQEEMMSAEKKINEIYDLLEAGEKFEDLAAKYSDDQSSKAKGGLLPLFGSGAKQRMVPEFEKAAFALENDGDYSKPFKTMFGYHIVKRIRVIPLRSFDDMSRELELRVERDMRAETTRQSFIENLKKEYNFTNNAKIILPYFYNNMGDEIFMAKWKGIENEAHDTDVLFEFKENFATFRDFEKYIISHQTKMRRVNKQMLVEDMYNQMVNEWIINYEDTQLEKKHPEFRSLIKEYGGGILVFEIMQDEIWKKASKDTTGIKDYFNAHRDEFTYPVRYRGELYTTKDKATAKKIVKMLKAEELTSKEIVHTVNKNSELNAKVKSQVFNSKTTEAFKIKKKKGKVKYKTFKKGLNKPYKNGDAYHILNVSEVLPARQREFDEARGLVTAAYQNQLEKEWLKSLRDKYSIKIHEETLYNLGNE